MRGTGGVASAESQTLAHQVIARAWSTTPPYTASAAHSLPDPTTPPPPCVTFRLVVAPLRGPGQSPGLPSACCIGSLRSVGRCGRCSCWCRFRVRRAQWLVCWGCAECAFARQQRPIVGVLRMCWLLPGSFDCFCRPHTFVHRPSTACLAVFLCGPGALFLHALSRPSTICPFPPHSWSAPDGLPLLLRQQPIWAAGDTPHLMPVEPPPPPNGDV